MFLKRLEIIGFKSFAERMSVDFVNGVTAVVGPNGSGKSNITESIRWVLGEQSAKSLRGTKMEDIIFSGSDSRKRMNMAEVSLILDNSDSRLPIDYKEVNITRRVYRSGESDFLINKQSCRLKDIVELFMDSGLGKESFSIISQGKVEEILSSKAEERRSIFEEAAGVLKYKTRKKKAEVKLDETQQNLDRVEDILHELSEQLEPLKIQSSIAKDYLYKKEQLEKNEVALLVHEIEDLNNKWEDLSHSFNKNQHQELEISSILQQKEAEIEQNRDRMEALDESIQELQQVLLVATEDLEKLEGRKEVLKERKKNASQNKQQLRSQIEELTELIYHREAEKKQQEIVFSSLYDEVITIRSKIEHKQKQLNEYDENVEEKLEELKGDYIEYLNKQATTKNELHFLNEQLESLGQKFNRQKNNNERYIKERKEIISQKNQLTVKLSKIDQQLSLTEKNLHNQEQQLTKTKDYYQEQESLLYKAYQYVNKVRSKKEMLESMQEDYTGFYQGVREVLKAKEKLKGIHGAVAELIQVETSYETAIEIALGTAAQQVIVENEQNARNAIQYLKRNSYGRATFLPLSTVKKRQITKDDLSKIKDHPSFIGIGSEITSYSEQYENVFKYLLGAVLISKDLQGANELARVLRHKYRIVTLEGDVVNPGGSMTGGAVKKTNQSLLNRNRELETLQKSLKEMETKTVRLEDEVKKVKEEIKGQEQQVNELTDHKQFLQMQIQTKRMEIREVEIKERNINEHLKIYDAEQDSYNDEKQAIHDKKQLLNEKLLSISEKITRLDKDIKELSNKKTTIEFSKQELIQELHRNEGVVC
ncbi:chromosome segregation protein SMC [Bacillus carboniphilus]|uniref:chromosome segregation protein SMC n=1 Tax=Bacillus carboniphilus TaxID=86663 RepID=UPI003FCEDCE7